MLQMSAPTAQPPAGPRAVMSRRAALPRTGASAGTCRGLETVSRFGAGFARWEKRQAFRVRCLASDGGGEGEDSADAGGSMSESEKMRQMFRLEQLLQTGGIAPSQPMPPAGMDPLSGRIQEAISQAEETCRETEDRVDCAMAWEEVSDLRSTQDRRSETGSARPVAPPSSTGPSVPLPIPRNEDPLRGLRPADVAPSMSQPTGSLLAAGYLERLSQRPSPGDSALQPSPHAADQEAQQQQQPPAAGAAHERPARVQEAKERIQKAVISAAEICDTPSPSQAEDCAVAWDEVEELSSAVEHKKKHLDG